MAEDAQYVLISILCEAGLSYQEASHFARAVDRGCWAGVTADRLGALLWRWMEGRRDVAVCRAAFVRQYGRDPGDAPFLPSIPERHRLF